MIKGSDIKNEDLTAPVGTDTELKDMIVDYVGTKLDPEDEQVTVEMVVAVFAQEFPEFVLSVAEENWIRGYEQGLADQPGLLDDLELGKLEDVQD